MSEKITGYTATSPEAMTTGAAVMYKNFDIAADTAATAAAKIISATSGGVEISIEKETWYREIDGVPENTKGMFEIESIKPSIKATLAEVSSVDALMIALGAATNSAPALPTGYTKVEPKHSVADSDYLDNITLLTQTKTGSPLIIVIDNPLNTDGLTFKTESKAGGGLDVEFVGHYDAEDLNTAPIRFYVPTPAV